jgi:RHS repeat-associated protein
VETPQGESARGVFLYVKENHLGNVLVTVWDRKISVDDNANGTTDYFLADVNTTNDYSAFGAPMPGRSYVSDQYRYGFNGKENDPESVSTGDGLQDYGFRIYNPSLGKFLSVDPDAHRYCSFSPYQFAGNCPITLIDEDGRGPKLPTNANVWKTMIANEPIFFIALLTSNNTSPLDFENWATGKGGSRFSKFQGVMGEVIFYQRMMTNLRTPKMICPPSRGPMWGIYTPDVALCGTIWSYGGVSYQIDVQTKSRICNTSSPILYASIETTNFEGVDETIVIGQNKTTGTWITVNYEVKTLSSSSDASLIYGQIVKGVDQTIARGQGEDTYGVLVIDRDAWLKVANSPYYGSQLRAQYNRLISSGNYLRLEKDLTSEASKRVFELQEEVQAESK